MTKTLKKITLKHIDSNCLELNLSFNKLVNIFCLFKSNFNLFNGRFFSLAECTIHTKHTVPYTKTQNMLQKRMNPNCIIINLSFHNFKNWFWQNKTDWNLKSSFLTLDFGHTGQSGVLAQTCSVWTLYNSKLLKNMFNGRKTNLFGPI